MFTSLDSAVQRAHRMVEEGAAIIDIGGESTRPGAMPVSVDEEIQRTAPVIAVLSKTLSVPISIDTQKPEVMRAGIDAGAGMVNDVFALRAPGALKVVRELDVPVCLMHMRGEPRTMQSDPVYSDVTREVLAFLRERLDACRDAGIAAERCLIDPGFGFGKTLDHNMQLLRDLSKFRSLGVPLVIGTSRKSMLGKILGGAPPEGRVFGGITMTVLAVQRGANLIRTHDVRATADALKVLEAAGSA